MERNTGHNTRIGFYVGLFIMKLECITDISDCKVFILNEMFLRRQNEFGYFG